jgi:hypothetical protein
MALLPPWVWQTLPEPQKRPREFRDALHRRMRALQERLQGSGVLAAGVAVGTGDAATTAFSFNHGMMVAPDFVLVTAGSAAAAGDFFATANATQVTVTYATPPPAAADNLTWHWVAGLVGGST